MSKKVLITGASGDTGRASGRLPVLMEPALHGFEFCLLILVGVLRCRDGPFLIVDPVLPKVPLDFSRTCNAISESGSGTAPPKLSRMSLVPTLSLL